jgi:hypothetical protein
MIKYQLTCDTDHEFEGWFRDSADYDAQSGASLIECPACGSGDVRKAMMAPAIARRTGSRSARLAGIKSDMAKAAERARDYVEKNFDYVGDQFSEEARKIHYGETKGRGIYGEATGKEVKELVEEGVRVAPLPGPEKKPEKAGKPKLPAAAEKKLN